MSANDVISLYWEKDKYIIERHDIENGESVYATSNDKTLLGAIRKARSLQNLMNPEYGIVIGRLKGDK